MDAPGKKNKGIELVLLYKSAGSEQLKRAALAITLLHVSPSLIKLGILSTPSPSSILACDLVITSGTLVAHLAGGLEVPTWLLLHPVPDWRWGLEGRSTAWCPSMGLFRQGQGGSWAEVIRSLKRALGPFLRSRLVNGHNAFD